MKSAFQNFQNYSNCMFIFYYGKTAKKLFENGWYGKKDKKQVYQTPFSKEKPND